MARIRTIKPELLEDEKVARLTHLEWRIFVSCILLADDFGNFRAMPERIHGAILFAHPREGLAKALDGLAAADLLVFYWIAGQTYAHISGWDKHQKVDHPGKPLCPGLTDNSRLSREGLARILEGLALDRDLDHDQGSGPLSLSSLRSGSEPTADLPARSNLWTNRDWLRVFGDRWISVYGGLAYGGGDATAKAGGQLRDILAALPETDALAAQARAHAMLDEFFGDASPKVVQARHPFTFFVTAFTGLRRPMLKAAPPPETFAERDKRLAHEAAERKRKADEATRVAMERKRAAERDLKPATPEELEELRTQRRGAQSA